MKKLICIFLVLAMLLTFAACNKDERVGKYICMDVDYGDGSGTPDGEWIELTSSKSGKINMGLELSFDWSAEGESFTMTTKIFTDTYTGTLKDGILVLNWGGVKYTFVKEGVSYTAPEKTQPTETEDPWAGLWTDPTDEPETEPTTEPETEPVVDGQNSLQAWWNGDYYGFWAVFPEGETTTDMWWDCCADIDLDEDGMGLIRIWDEDYNDANDGIAMSKIYVVGFEDEDYVGYGLSAEGFFLDYDLADSDWVLDPYYEDFEGGIQISGAFTTDDGTYTYDIFLRKWGMDWEDLVDTTIGTPYYYEDWYLPAIEAGYPMPSTVLGECGDGLEPQPLGPGFLTSDFIPVESDEEVLVPLEKLQAVYKVLSADWDVVYYMDYADIINTYMEGLEGRIGYVSDEGDYFCMYWLADGSDTYSTLEIDFELNEDGIWMYASKGASNDVLD